MTEIINPRCAKRVSSFAHDKRGKHLSSRFLSSGRQRGGTQSSEGMQGTGGEVQVEFYIGDIECQ